MTHPALAGPFEARAALDQVGVGNARLSGRRGATAGDDPGSERCVRSYVTLRFAIGVLGLALPLLLVLVEPILFLLGRSVALTIGTKLSRG